MDERINEVAWRLFTQRGYARVTMDDLASELGISKKTLYAAIPGKEALLHRLVKAQVAKAEAYTLGIVNDPDLSTLEKLRKLPAYGMSIMMDIQPVLLEDVRKMAPETWAEAEKLRDRIINERLGKIIRDGIANGELRDDLEADIVQDVFYCSLSGVILNFIPITDALRFVTLIDTTIQILYSGLTKGKSS